MADNTRPLVARRLRPRRRRVRRRARRRGASRSRADDDLRQQAVDLQVAAERHHYTYQWEWAGVPVIRIPDDIMVLQELFWSYRPERVVETGVARGGSMLLERQPDAHVRPRAARCSASTTSSTPTPRRPCASTRWAVASSCSRPTRRRTTARRGGRSAFIGGAERVVLVLDSNHTHDHVLGELARARAAAARGRPGAGGRHPGRGVPGGPLRGPPLGPGQQPADRESTPSSPSDDDFTPAGEWGRRALVTEFRDGILRRR